MCRKSFCHPWLFRTSVCLSTLLSVHRRQTQPAALPHSAVHQCPSLCSWASFPTGMMLSPVGQQLTVSLRCSMIQSQSRRLPGSSFRFSLPHLNKALGTPCPNKVELRDRLECPRVPSMKDCKTVWRMFSWTQLSQTCRFGETKPGSHVPCS